METKRIYYLLACFILASSLFGQSSDQKLILGTWASSTDNTWKFIFTPDGICKQYSGRNSLETDSYNLANTSPQCGEDVHVDENTLFLSLKDLSGEFGQYCYEIENLDDKYLSITPVGLGGIYLFVRSFTDTVTMNPPFKALSCTVANTGVDVSLKMRFYADPGIRANGQYILGNIPPDLRPDEAHQLTVQGGGCTWTVVVTPDGSIIGLIVKGTPPPAGQPIDLDELHYQLFEPHISPTSDPDGK